jgi:Tfp pilus assembly PilM family ATPase
MAKGKKIKIGIDLGTNSIKIACFFTKKKHKSNARLLKYDYLLEDVVTDIREVNETHIVNGLKDLLGQLPYRRADINVGVSADFQNTFFLQLPQIASHELKQALFWELSPLLSSPVDNFEFDFSLLPQTEKKKVNILLAVVQKSRIEWLQKVFKSLSGGLNLLETTTLPTVDLFNHSYPKLEDTVGILHLGGSNSHYTILDPNQYPEFLFLPFGGNTLNTLIAKSADIPLKEVEYLRRGELETSSSNQTITTLYMGNKKIEKQLKDLALTIRKNNFRHFYNTGQKVSKLYVTGGLTNDPFIRSFFTHSEKILEIPAETWDPISEYYPNVPVDSTNAFQFSTAIGLAVR